MGNCYRAFGSYAHAWDIFYLHVVTIFGQPLLLLGSHSLWNLYCDWYAADYWGKKTWDFNGWLRGGSSHSIHGHHHSVFILTRTPQQKKMKWFEKNTIFYNLNEIHMIIKWQFWIGIYSWRLLLWFFLWSKRGNCSIVENLKTIMI